MDPLKPSRIWQTDEFYAPFRKRPISRTQRRFTQIAPKAVIGGRDSRERILEALERAL